MSSQVAAPTDATEVVTTFLRHLEAGDLDAAMALMTEDAVWINVSLPTVRGRARIDRVVRALDRRGNFDWLDLMVSLVRAAARVVVPSLNRPWPGDV